MGRSSSAVDSVLDEITEGTVNVPTAAMKELVGDDESVTEADAPIIKLVSLIILEAFRNRASDIHIEPMAKQFAGSLSN